MSAGAQVGRRQSDLEALEEQRRERDKLGAAGARGATPAPSVVTAGGGGRPLSTTKASTKGGASAVSCLVLECAARQWGCAGLGRAMGALRALGMHVKWQRMNTVFQRIHGEKEDAQARMFRTLVSRWIRSSWYRILHQALHTMHVSAVGYVHLLGVRTAKAAHVTSGAKCWQRMTGSQAFGMLKVNAGAQTRLLAWRLIEQNVSCLRKKGLAAALAQWLLSDGRKLQRAALVDGIEAAKLAAEMNNKKAIGELKVAKDQVGRLQSQMSDAEERAGTMTKQVSMFMKQKKESTDVEKKLKARIAEMETDAAQLKAKLKLATAGQ